ncbi:endonuclease/exonuclease/phosphatase family protein [Seonamhaeicola marinus]|uniref:Endonuclease/exonuclease/phosphatase family protein n=1 Tax=Seonamhaeicola marinus TaxID=1912246 RepID=A0A5D0HFP7_9FLAO|nr:endonuclease/exonuclease/phosphatase family protein [Seonamhaeicola marinus]
MVLVGNTQEKKRYKIHTIAFYNLENLFDAINEPNKLDEYSPIMEIKTDRAKVYKRKIKNMARVISDIGYDSSKNTPSIIGVCEIENHVVLEDLVNSPDLIDSDYGIIQYDSPDARGIDVALLYQKRIFTPLHSKTYELKIYDREDNKRIYTRDQLLVSGKLENEDIHILVNHWPSRRGGETKSRSKRIAAAQLSKHIIDSLQTKNPYSKVVIMGDLNDNPTNVSVKKILKAKTKKGKVGLKGIYNPFTKFYNNGLGTTAYRDTWSLFDQILVTKPFLTKDYTSLKLYKARIFNKNYLITKSGTYKGYPFRSWSNGGFSNGYSDHFPVYIQIVKEVKK